MAIGEIIYVGGKPRMITQEFLVRRPVSESPEERALRVKKRLPEPTFGYTVIRTEPVTHTEQDTSAQ